MDSQFCSFSGPVATFDKVRTVDYVQFVCRQTVQSSPVQSCSCPMSCLPTCPFSKFLFSLARQTNELRPSQINLLDELLVSVDVDVDVDVIFT